MGFFRLHRRLIASQVLALLSTVWLSLALAPCAMALGELPGAEPGMAAEAPPCDHCPPSQSHCDTEQSSQCALEAQVVEDSALFPSGDQPQPVMAPAPELSGHSRACSAQLAVPPSDGQSQAFGPPLYKRYCVYLD